MQILRQRDVIGRINVSPREIDQFLERQKKMPSESNEYDVSHILIAVPQAATPDELDDGREEGRRGLRRRPLAARTSRAWRCSIPTRRPRSKAAGWDCARDRSCPPSWPK